MRMCAQTSVLSERRREGSVVPRARSARRVYFSRRLSWGRES